MHMGAKPPTIKTVLSRIFLVCVFVLLVLKPVPAVSVPLPSEGPQRSVILSMDYTIYEWWLLSGKLRRSSARFTLNTDPGLTTAKFYIVEAASSASEKTSACVFDDQITNPQQCAGLYLHLANVTPSSRKVEVKLPPAEVYISVVGCGNAPGKNQGTSLPFLRLEAVEPLPNEQIILILGTLNGQPFTCPGNICDLPLSPTGMNGVEVVFWAESSYGDASKKFNAQVRVIPWGDFANPDAASADQPVYYVDVLSSQYHQESLSSCSNIWQAFLPVDGAPTWLNTPSLQRTWFL